MIKTPVLSTSLYWSLPGPRDFVTRVAQNVRTARATAISLQTRDVAGLWDRVRDGLVNAYIEKPVDLAIGEYSNLEAEIGGQFGYEYMTPAQLAQHNVGTVTAVVLRPRDSAGAARCEKYFTDFMRALPDSTGDVRLLLAIRDGHIQQDMPGNDVQAIAFDYGLTPAEMQAYVGLRMIGRSGPGSTNLLTSLVTEFAGFDPMLAERLIDMSPMDMYALPHSLTPLLEVEPLRWASDNWGQGTVKTIDGATVLHPLREWYLANHKGPRKKEMETAARRRFWRACVKALTPWLEERRAAVIDIFKRPLDVAEMANGGVLTRPVGVGNSTIPILRDEIEYNNIVGMVRNSAISIPSDDASQRALTVCRKAKEVRDAIAHLRPPSITDILDLISQMDLLIPPRALNAVQPV